MCPTPWACYLCKSVSAASPITSGHPAQLLRVGVENLSSHITQVLKLLAAGCSSLLRLHKGWRSEEVRLWKSNPQGLLRHFWFMAFLSHTLLEAGGRSGDKLLILPFSRVLCLTFFFFSVLNHFFFFLNQEEVLLSKMGLWSQPVRSCWCTLCCRRLLFFFHKLW